MVDEQVDLRRRPRDVRIGVEVGDAILGEDVLAEKRVPGAFAAGPGEDRVGGVRVQRGKADLYLLKFILHDWDDESCVKILRRCRESMQRGARIVVIELLVGEIADPGPGALMDLNMLVAVSGRERSLSEYDALLTAGGLRRTSVVGANQSPLSVIEAVAV